MVGKFTARRHWQIFRSAGKKLANFVLSHGAVYEPEFIFWISRRRIARKNGLSDDLASSDLLYTNFLKQDTGHFLSPVSYALGRKDLWCLFSSPWRVLLSLSCLFQVFFTTCFVFFQSDVIKFNLSCFMSVSEVNSKWKPSYAQVLQAHGRQIGFLQECVQHLRLSELLWRSIWFLYPSSRRMAFRTFLDTLNSSSLRMFTFALLSQESLDTSREGGHCVKFVYSELSFFIAVIWKLHGRLFSSSGGISTTFCFSPNPFRNLWNTFIS